jgi:hypothetical protein
MNIENFKPNQILLILLIIIILIPFLFTLPAISKYFEYSNTGGIGDTIGGITAPFINGFSALLVFLAFKAQINANEIFKNQEQSRIILDQIKIIQEDKLKIEEYINSVNRQLHLLSKPPEINLLNSINKITYFTSEIHLAYELIESYSKNKDFLYRKLYYLYVIMYKDLVTNLENNLKREAVHMDPDYRLNVSELLLELEFIHKNLDDVNKYKKTTANTL